jgi:hypothetical protein
MGNSNYVLPAGESWTANLPDPNATDGAGIYVKAEYDNLPSGGGTDPWQTFVESVEHCLWGKGESK